MPKRPVLICSLLAALLLPMAGCDTYPRYGEVEVGDRHHSVRVVFSDRDIDYLRDYYRPRHPHGYPPGLAKQGKIPPGHAMKLRMGQPFPPEYSWRPLPRELEGRLSPLPDGYARVIVGTDIGILNLRTRVVVDLLEDLAD